MHGSSATSGSTPLDMDLSTACRICLKAITSAFVAIDSCTHLYGSDGSSPRTIRIIEMLVDVSGDVFDRLRPPNGICEPCLADLRTAFAFKKRCERATERLAEVADEAIEKSSSTSGSSVPIEELLVTTNGATDSEPEQLEHMNPIENSAPERRQACQALPIVNLGEKVKIPAGHDPKPATTDKSFTCEHCGKAFSRLFRLKRHLLIHTGERNFECDICGKRFQRRDYLIVHMGAHAKAKQLPCDFCTKTFSRLQYLRQHIQARHADAAIETAVLPACAECDQTFATDKGLRKHVKLHAKHAFDCAYCDKTFSRSVNLAKHCRTAHTNEKPYLCSECGVRFVRKDYLIIHMRRHRGDKPFKCQYCGKGFPRSTDLTVHERYHTNERSHVCAVCNKGFQRGYNLAVHMRVHTGEKPYQCPHCTKSFTQSNDVKAHIRRIHTGERFKCDVCGEGFIQTYNLTQHKRTAHGIEAQSHIGRVAKVAAADEMDQSFPAGGESAASLMQAECQ